LIEIGISPYTKSSIRITGKRLNFSGSLSKSVQPSIILGNMIIHMILEIFAIFGEGRCIG